MNTFPISEVPSPHILVLGMGGTIAGLAPNPEEHPMQYQAGQVGVKTLLSHVQSAIPQGVAIETKQVFNVNSRDLTEPQLSTLGGAVRNALDDPAVRGIVITHGTDTMEETGLFLQLVCGKQAQKLGKRVILTGAMRPSNASDPDGPSNLLDALRWASTPIDNCPGGIYAVMDGRGCMAMDLAKRHTAAPNAPIQDSPSSSVGLINPSWLFGVKAVQALWNEDLSIPQEGEWPWVEILTSHAGARPEAIRHWFKSGIHGLVIAGTGNGGIHEAWNLALRDADQHQIALVRASRVGAGTIYSNIPETEISGCLASGTLSPPKARMALQLAIYAANQTKLTGKPLTWQVFFARITDLPEIK